MIYEGMIDEGLAIVLGTRMRHRGDRRNPWDEFECGHHYSRSMASYALLPALSGFSYSAPEHKICFSPKIFKKNFQVFFSTSTGWGVYKQKIDKNKAQYTIEPKYGSITIKQIILPITKTENLKITVTLNGKRQKINFQTREQKIEILLKTTKIDKEQKIEILVI